MYIHKIKNYTTDEIRLLSSNHALKRNLKTGDTIYLEREKLPEIEGVLQTENIQYELEHNPGIDIYVITVK